MPLTATAVRNAKPEDKTFRLFDGEGMYSGGTSNRRHLLAPEAPSRRQGEAPTLGVFPEVSLAEARERRAAARKLLAAGQDPSEANKIEKRARRLQAERPCGKGPEVSPR